MCISMLNCAAGHGGVWSCMMPMQLGAPRQYSSFQCQTLCSVFFRGLQCCFMSIVFQPFTLQRPSCRGFVVATAAQDTTGLKGYMVQAGTDACVQGRIVSLSRSQAEFGVCSLLNTPRDIGHVRCSRTKQAQWPIHDTSHHIKRHNCIASSWSTKWACQSLAEFGGLC